MMKIVFVIASLRRGGAEGIAATLANAWQDAGHVVQFLTFDRPAGAVAYPLRGGVAVTPLDLMETSNNIVGAIASNVKRVRVLRAAINAASPDVVLSFMLETNIVTLLASVGAPWPVVISERIHPAVHPVSLYWSLLRRLLYRGADVVVAQTADIADWLVKHTHAKVRVIANPIDHARFRVRSTTKPSKRKKLLSVGRLDWQKGHDIAIEAFARAATELADWDFAIVGEGPERTALERQIQTLGMADRISLAGAVSNIIGCYIDADAFMHCARYEGYPNVIVEALTASLPVIAVDAPGATRELLDDGTYGVLVPTGDAELLSRALRATLGNPAKLSALRKRATSATEANDVNRIAPRWLALFQGVTR